MSHKFQVKMTPESFENLAKELLNYTNSLDYKLDTFINRMTQEGIRVIDERISQAEGADNGEHYNNVRIHSFGKNVTAIIEVQGEQIMFIEFGAGVYYNGAADSSPHPYGEQMGYTIGNYSEKHLGRNKTWTYESESGERILTHGTKATMPLYMANKYWIDNCIRIAKEVFG